MAKKIKNERKKWNEEDIKFLQENYKSMANSKLAKHFNVSLKSIETKLHKLGLKREAKSKKSKLVEIKHKMKPPISEERKRAIAIFDKGIHLYKEGKKEEAFNEFKKVLSDYSDVIDVACKAREYLK
ncbi:hypothetical protein KAW65_09270 [candidate division WOR-3 bacterium]|nr:hypothetical protein [candidate division WOR-3 bacterium]